MLSRAASPTSWPARLGPLNDDALSVALAKVYWPDAVKPLRNRRRSCSCAALRLDVPFDDRYTNPDGQVAHGFVALEDGTEVLYKTTDFYHKASERSIRWDDPTLAVAWPADLTPLLADKDAAAPLLADADIFD